MPKVQVAVAVVAVLTLSTHLAAADEVAPEPRDRDAALTLSAGGTVASIGLMLAGQSTGTGAVTTAGLLSLLITPSAGEIYAGNLFTAGMGIRLGSLGAGLVGLIELVDCPLFEAGGCSGGGGAALLALGALGYATGIVYDIATAGRAVDDYNQRLHLRVTPTVIPTASSAPAVGLGIGGSF